MHKTLLKKSFLLWLPFAALITFVCLLSYLLVQQDFRMTANDPQIEVAEDVAQALGNGISPQDIVPPGQVINIATSLDPFIIIFDASGKVLASSATLNGKTPAVPRGVFASLQRYGIDGAQNRFTWEPAFGVRSAAVVTDFSGSTSSSTGFVLAGRSLREVEIREDNVLHLAIFAWLAGLIAMFVIVWATVEIYKKKHISSS